MKSSAETAESLTSDHVCAWPLVSLREILTQRSPEVRVEPTGSYQFAGVYSFGRGVFRGPLKKGNEFAYTVLTRLRSGEFVYPKLMAWEGAFGVVPAVCDGFFVSPEFPVFEIDVGKADPRFVEIYFKSARTWNSISSRSTGTNVRRRRLNPSSLLQCQIPLPPLTSQRQIADRLGELGARMKLARDHFVSQAKDLRDLLDAEFNQIEKDSAKRLVRDIAPIVRRAVKVELDQEYPELGVRSFGRGTFHKPSLTGADLGGKRVFKIKEGDLVFMNVFAWEGAIAVAGANDDGRFGSHRFITCVPKPEAITAEFLCFYFLSNAGLEKIRNASPGSAGRNRTLSIDALMQMLIPCPALSRQTSFDNLCSKVAAVTRCAEAHLKDLEALERSMVAMALRGELSGAEAKRTETVVRRPSDARDYLAQFVPALLRASGGSLALEQVTEAYALFFQRKTLFDLLAKTGDQFTRRHFRDSPPLDKNVYRKMLDELHHNGIVAPDPLEPMIGLRLNERNAPPTWPTVAEDAKYLADVLSLVPHDALRETVRKLCPDPARNVLLTMN